jgi:hypothetical protein
MIKIDDLIHYYNNENYDNVIDIINELSDSIYDSLTEYVHTKNIEEARICINTLILEDPAELGFNIQDTEYLIEYELYINELQIIRNNLPKLFEFILLENLSQSYNKVRSGYIKLMKDKKLLDDKSYYKKYLKYNEMLANTNNIIQQLIDKFSKNFDLKKFIKSNKEISNDK